MREIMDELSFTSSTQEVALMKATQISGTVTLENWWLYTVDMAPCPFFIVHPTLDLARDHSRQKLAPTITAMPRVKSKIRDVRTRDSGNTMLCKEYPGGILFLSGANSPASFRQKSVRCLGLDDLDGFEMTTEGDSEALALRRTDAFGSRKKIFRCSTPTLMDTSRIWKAFNAGSKAKYHVPCPHCGEYQELLWGGPGAAFGIKFTRGAENVITDVWYECRHCHSRIDESSKTYMLGAGRWVHEHPERLERSYHISSLYSPLGLVSWRQIVKEFLEAKSDPSRLQVWTNTRLGLPWEDRGERPEIAILMARAEPYEILTVPAGAKILTAGVDVQDDRLALAIWGWGRGEESWLVWWGELYGDPAQPHVWGSLDEMLFRDIPGQGGVKLRIVSAAVDTGGHHNRDVQRYCRDRVPRVIAIKGSSKPNQPILGKPTLQDVDFGGVKIKNGIQLWPVGTDTAKATIYARLKISDPGPGYMHFPIGIQEEFYRQLTGEKRITKYVKGFPKHEWVKIRRNEALDITVYAYAAAIRAGIDRVDWDRAEGKARQEKPKQPKPQVRESRW